MQIFENFDGSTFKLNSKKYVKNFIVMPVGTTSIAIYNAYDTSLQLLPATSYKDIKVNNASFQSQQTLMEVLSPMLFSKVVYSDGILPNQIIYLSEMNRLGNRLAIPAGCIWRIDGIVLSNDSSFFTDIAPATDGFHRIDIIVAKSDSTFEKIQGGESSTVATAPFLPPNSLLVTTINISGNEINDGNEPIVGSLYIEKTDEAIVIESRIGEITIDIDVDGKNKYKITDADVILGFSANLISRAAMWTGKPYFVTNTRNTSIKLKHNTSNIYGFSFPSHEDMILPAGGTAMFYFDKRMIYVGLEFKKYASLDSNGKVPLSQINDALLGNVNYQGLWNSATNAPDLTVVGTKGHYYINTVSGIQFGKYWENGDWIISDGNDWAKVDNTDAVSSVAGRTGNIILTKDDIEGLTATLAATAVDSNVVHKLGNITESINGEKTFTSPMKVNPTTTEPSLIVTSTAGQGAYTTMQINGPSFSNNDGLQIRQATDGRVEIKNMSTIGGNTVMIGNRNHNHLILNNDGTSTFNGKVKGVEATNPNEFTTLSQVSTKITNGGQNGAISIGSLNGYIAQLTGYWDFQGIAGLTLPSFSMPNNSQIINGLNGGGIFKLYLGDTDYKTPYISKNQAGSRPTFEFIDENPDSTGDIVTFKNSDGVVARMFHNGDFAAKRFYGEGFIADNGTTSVEMRHFSPSEPAIFFNGIYRMLYAANYGIVYNVGSGENQSWRINNDPYNQMEFNSSRELRLGYATAETSTGEKLQVNGKGMFNGTVKGLPATLPTEFVTKAQLDLLGSGQSSSGLEKITQEGKSGWRLKGIDAQNYGSVGQNSLDLSVNNGNAGQGNGATGDNSSILGGQFNKAIGEFSNILGGDFNIANSNYSTVIGRVNTIGTNADASIAIGSQNEIFTGSYNANAIGYGNYIYGQEATAIGSLNIARSFRETVLGSWSSDVAGSTNTWVATQPILRVGIGTSNSDRKDALRIYKNGNVELTQTLPSGGSDATQVLFRNNNGVIVQKPSDAIFFRKELSNKSPTVVTYTLAQTDERWIVQFFSDSPVTVTVPASIVQTTRFEIRQMGLGQVTIVGASGVILKTITGKTPSTISQYGLVTLEQTGSVSGNTWIARGDLANAV